MSLTITRVPPDFSSMHGDCIYTCLDSVAVSDPTDYQFFKYICDVYIGGSLQARIKKVPNPTTGVGIYNIGSVIRNYVLTNFIPTPGIPLAQSLAEGEFYLTVDVHFGEEYRTAAGNDLTLYPDLAIDGVPLGTVAPGPGRRFYNSYEGRIMGVSNALTRKQDNVASNRPASAEVLMSSPYLLFPFFPSSGAAPIQITVNTFKGTPLVFYVNPSARFALQMINLSPVVLNAIQPGTITNETQHYIVTIGLFYACDVRVVCEPDYSPYMLHFLNQYGGFESKLFQKASKTNYDITRSDYGRLPYTVDSGGQVSYNNASGIYNETDSVYSVQATESLSLNTDWLSDQEYKWLRDLLFSPMIFLETVDGFIFPAKINDTSYEIKRVVTDQLTSLSISLSYGTNYNSQYR